jgi:hypothetical protein
MLCAFAIESPREFPAPIVTSGAPSSMSIAPGVIRFISINGIAAGLRNSA